MFLYEFLCKCKGKYRNEGIKRIHDTCSKAGYEACLMSLAQGFLHNQNGNRPDRRRRTHSNEKAFEHVNKHNTYPFKQMQSDKGSNNFYIFAFR